MVKTFDWAASSGRRFGRAMAGAIVVALLFLGSLLVFSGGGQTRAQSAPADPTEVPPAGSTNYAGGIASSAPGRGVAAEVLESLQTKSKVAVIVSLREPPASKALPLGRETLREEIAASQEAVLAVLDPSDFELTYRYEAVPGFAGLLTASGAKVLATNPGVAAVGLDRQVFATLNESVPLINADDVHALGITGAGVTVAVLDTGIDTNHPQLSDDLVAEHCYLSGGGCPGGAHPAEDDQGHGSHVSGIITSPAGVAPDAQIIASKVLDSTGSGTFSDMLAALDHLIAAHPETDAVNMSIGDSESYAPGTCDGLYPALTTAIETLRTAGATTFVASGNEASKSGISFPACINAAVSVGAVYDANVGSRSWYSCSDPATAADQVTCFSNSDTSLDLLAPGSVITSSAMGGGTIDMSGTSMAAPHAAGVAALLLDDEPALTSEQVEARLEQRGVPVTDAANGITTCRVNALAAVQDSGPICEPGGPSLPENDDFVDALSIPSTPFTHGQSTIGATMEPGEPQPCGGIGSTVWFSFQTPADGTLTASTVGGTYDTVLAGYHGPDLPSLVLDSCNDDYQGLQSQISFPVASGVTYFIQTGGFHGATGSLVINVSFIPAGPAEVLLIQDAYPWGCTADEQALQELGKTYHVMPAAQAMATDLSQYEIVLVASDQYTSTYDTLAASKSVIESYISGGGVLVAHAADGGWNGGFWATSWLPGAVQHQWISDDYLSVLDPTHPVVAGMPGGGPVTDAELDEWNWSTHGYFTGLLPGTAKVIGITVDPQNEPVYLEYTFGSGRVLATMQTLEWMWPGCGGESKPNATAARNVLRNEILHAQQEPTPTTVTIGSGSVGPGGYVSVRLQAEDICVPGLGAFTTDIAYDPAVVIPAASTPNPDGVMDSVFWNPDWESDGVNPDKIRVGGFRTACGATGDIPLADIIFQAVGPSGSQSPLTLTPQEFADCHTDAIEVTPVHGSITVGLCGDVNSSGGTTMVDAMLKAQCVVGLIDCGDIDEWAADVNCSGTDTMVDAMLIAQKVVGLIPDLNCCVCLGDVCPLVQVSGRRQGG